MSDQAYHDPNTYVEIFNSIAPGDYYGDSIDVVNGGEAIRLNVGGRVVVRSLRAIMEACWNVADQKLMPTVERTPDTDPGRGTYFPDRKVVR